MQTAPVIQIIVIVTLFALLALFLIAKRQAQKLYRASDRVKEAFWNRSCRLPLLIEIVAHAGLPGLRKAEMIEIRAKASSGAYTLEEQIELEKKMTGMILETFRNGHSHDPLKTETLFHSLEKEFEGQLEEIRHALNDYNFEVKLFVGKPLKFFRFAFEAGKFKPLQLL